MQNMVGKGLAGKVQDLVDQFAAATPMGRLAAVSYTHLRAHETVLDLVCRLLLEKKKHRQTDRDGLARRKLGRGVGSTTRRPVRDVRWKQPI